MVHQIGDNIINEMYPLIQNQGTSTPKSDQYAPIKEFGNNYRHVGLKCSYLHPFDSIIHSHQDLFVGHILPHRFDWTNEI